MTKQELAKLRDCETKYCDTCEKVMRLAEDGYCRGCGKHADNIKQNGASVEEE